MAVHGRRLPVSFIATAERRNHWSIAEIAEDFSITEEEVLAALLYYREHRDAINAQDAEEIRQWEIMRAANPRRPGMI